MREYAEPRFDVEEGDIQRKRFSTTSESPRPVDDSTAAENREPYDCISNPAPWHHQITVRPPHPSQTFLLFHDVRSDCAPVAAIPNVCILTYFGETCSEAVNVTVLMTSMTITSTAALCVACLLNKSWTLFVGMAIQSIVSI